MVAPRASEDASPDRRSRSALSSFVGRESDALASRLAEGRLVTIVGPGGMGQTRLALRFAADHADAYAAHDGGGAWFSRPLGGAYRRRHASAVASALGVSLAVRDGDAAMAEHVGRALRGRGRLLLVLDDFERLVDAAPGTVVPWLRAVARAASLRVREIRDRLARSGALACADADASLRAEAHLSRGIARPCASRSRSRAVDADMLGP